jgi:hypothetical protein
VPVEDQVFDEIEAIDLMGDTWRESSYRRECAYHVLVSCVAQVDNPYRVGKRTQVGITVASGVGAARTPIV